tara:strand:+ start:7275 stop:7847 length:573 start_codon:yes stop_codon:yes gene_type:complete
MFIFQELKKWDSCKRCPLHKTRRNVVHCRQKINFVENSDQTVTFLLVGEAPGKIEDIYRKPFIAESGKLLDEAIEKTIERNSETTLQFIIANSVGCIPLDESNKIRPPSQTEVDACSKRLELIDRTISHKKSKFRISIGQSAKLSKIKFDLNITHPEAILRKNGDIDLWIARFVVTIEDLIKELIPTSNS